MRLEVISTTPGPAAAHNLMSDASWQAVADRIAAWAAAVAKIEGARPES